MSNWIFRAALILFFFGAFVWLQRQSEIDRVERQASCLKRGDVWRGNSCYSRE